MLDFLSLRSTSSQGHTGTPLEDRVSKTFSVSRDFGPQSPLLGSVFSALLVVLFKLDRADGLAFFLDGRETELPQLEPATRVADLIASVEENCSQVTLNHSDANDGASSLSISLDEFNGNEVPSKLGAQSIQISLRRQQQCISLDYVPSIYEPYYIEWFGKIVAETLIQILQNSQRRIETLALLTPDLEKQVLSIGAGLKVPSPTHLVLDHLRSGADRAPEKAAVVFQDQSVSYSDLMLRASAIAAKLLEYSPSHAGALRVAVCAPPSHTSIEVMLGIWAAGGVYIPIDTETPAERVQFILKDSSANLVLGSPEFFEKTGHVPNVKALDLRRFCAANKDVPATLQFPTSHVHQLAYIIYTSGSTGQPKGVGITQGTLVNHMLGWMKVGASAAPDRLSGVVGCSLGFDVSIWEILYTLWQSGTLHVLDSETLRSPKKMAAYICDRDITFACIRPTMLAGVLDWFVNSGKPLPVAQLFSGAEAVSAKVCDAFRQIRPDIEIAVGYGATETTICATRGVFDPEHGQEDIPVGKPLPGYHLCIVNTFNELLPPGAKGEILVGGDVLSNGYLNRPDESAQSFIPNPFSDLPNQTIYRTGDIGRLLPDGNLVFCGRRDNQLKVGGLRTELGEVEAAIRSVSGLENVAVVAWGEGTQKSLVAYLQGSGDWSRIRSDLAKKLPAPMVPIAGIFMTALPLNSSMKVDRKNLPTPKRSHIFSASGVTATTETERKLIALAESTFKISGLGVDDDLHRLGVNSLLMVSFIDTANATFGVDVPLADLLIHRSVRALGTRVAEKSKSKEVQP